jgi:glycosyltransferase involved in cell wall biosynthesis
VPKLVSIVTAVYGPLSRYLAETHASILDSRLPTGWAWEWCLQEDGDSPLGLAGLGLPANDERIRYGANGSHRLAGATRNLALARAGGAVTAFIDGDDLFTPGGLELLLDGLHSAPDTAWALGRADDLLPDGTLVAVPPDLPPGRVEAGTLLRRTLELQRSPAHGACGVVKTAVALSVGGMMTIPRAEDQTLWVVAGEFHPGHFVDDRVFLYRRWEHQTSGRARFRDEESHIGPVVRRIAELRSRGGPGGDPLPAPE